MAYSCAYFTSDDPAYTARGRPARQARPGLPQARPRARACRLPRHRLRLGLAVAARRRALRRAGRRRDDRRRAEGVHRRPDRRARSRRTGSRSGCRTTARCPSAALRHGRLDRDGRARRRAQLPDVRRRCCTRSVRPGGRVLIQQMSRTGTPPRRRPVHRVVHRPGHAHAPGRRDRRANRARRASRSATCTRCASTTCCTVAGLAGDTSRRNWDRLVAAGRRGGRAGVAALPRRRRAGLPRRAGWASTRS